MKNTQSYGMASGMYVDDHIAQILADEIRKEIDQMVIDEMTAGQIISREKEEAALRDQYPALQQAWEEYQVALRLIKSGSETDQGK